MGGVDRRHRLLPVNAQQSFDYTGMWSGIIVLAIIGIVANLLFVAAENRVLHWHYGQRAVEGVSR